jgi:four helix bundle protein
MNYAEWEQSVHQAITSDVLWRMEVYRYALFAGDISWDDVSKLIGDRRTLALADQLYRAVGSVSANIAEGYSRASDKDQARFYEYALGSARESRDWYYKARHVLGEPTTSERLELLARITRILLVVVRNHRGKSLREVSAIYEFTEGDE